MSKQKAQISLEYILITLAIVSILSIIIWQVSSLYSKNVVAIDNKEIKNVAEDIRSICSSFYLQPNSNYSLSINNQTEWSLEKKDPKSFYLKNTQKEHLIECEDKIILEINQIEKDKDLLLKKENNTVYINVK